MDGSCDGTVRTMKDPSSSNVSAALDASWPLLRLARVYRNEIEDVFAEEATSQDRSLGPLGVAVLLQIADEGTVNQQTLIRVLCVQPSVLVSVLDTLEKAGYLKRGRDPLDGRRRVVEIRPKGATAANRLVPLMKRAEDRTFARLTPVSRRRLAELMDKALDGSGGR